MFVVISTRRYSRIQVNLWIGIQSAQPRACHLPCVNIRYRSGGGDRKVDDFSQPINSKADALQYLSRRKHHLRKVSDKAFQNHVIVRIEEADIEEKFVRGSGPGGQSINKTMNNVQLLHTPTGIRVSCQEQRELSTNRKLARKMLYEKVDDFYNGANKTSKLHMKAKKAHRRKAKSNRRARQKYGASSGTTAGEDGIIAHSDSTSFHEDEDDDDDDSDLVLTDPPPQFEDDEEEED